MIKMRFLSSRNLLFLLEKIAFNEAFKCFNPKFIYIAFSMMTVVEFSNLTGTVLCISLETLIVTY